MCAARRFAHRPSLGLVAALAASCLQPGRTDFTPVRFAEGALHSITILHGDRFYEDDELDRVDDASVWGLAYDVFAPGSIGLEVEWAQSNRDALGSQEPGVIDHDVHELSVGGRMTWVYPGTEVFPFASLGVVSILSDRRVRLADASTREVSDEDWGLYATAGFDYYVDLNLYVGVQLSWVQEEWFDPGGVDHDGFRLLMRLGWTY